MIERRDEGCRFTDEVRIGGEQWFFSDVGSFMFLRGCCFAGWERRWGLLDGWVDVISVAEVWGCGFTPQNGGAGKL